jgi:hypothetical protein
MLPEARGRGRVTKMRNRVAWGLALLLAVLLLSGGGVLIRRTYYFDVRSFSGRLTFGYEVYPAGSHVLYIGPLRVIWWPRSDQATRQDD